MSIQSASLFHPKKSNITFGDVKISGNWHIIGIDAVFVETITKVAYKCLTSPLEMSVPQRAQNVT